jgi:hypothetical protein
LTAVSASNPHRYPETDDEPDVGRDGGSAAGRPRWTTLLAIATGIVVILTFVVLHLTGVMGSGGH